MSIAFSCTSFPGKASKLVLNFHSHINGIHTPFNLKEFIMPGRLGGHFIVFQLFYACTVKWERFSQYPYKLTPPIFQTGIYYLLPETKAYLPISLIQVPFLSYRLLKVLLRWVKDKQIYKHTHTLVENSFS